MRLLLLAAGKSSRIYNKIKKNKCLININHKSLIRNIIDSAYKNKIEKIEPSAGDKFDPKFHQAMFEGKSEKEEKGNIMQVLSIGFSIGDRLLRASHVAVSSGKINNDTISESEET